MGAADSPYTRQRLAANDLLHAYLLELKGPEIVGVDIDDDGLGVLRRAYPSAQFANFDVSRHVPAEHEGSYDLVIASEVLEHVENGGLFLRGCRQLLTEGGLLSVTVPNACSPKIGLRALVGSEVVHPDHLVYYSPRTLAHALHRAGYELSLLATYSAERGPLGVLLAPILELSAGLFTAPIGEGLIAVARPATGRR